MSTVTTPTARALAPDLARGAMLLLIVLSNTTYYLWGGFGESVPDRLTGAVMAVVLDLRVYPMFAFLVGYGLVQFHRGRHGGDPAISLLRRRGLWLITFGLAHAALLMSTDVLGTWGLFTLVLAGLFLRRSDRTVLTWCGVGLGYLVLVLVALTAAHLAGLRLDLTEGTDSAVALAASGEPGYLTSLLVRTMSWPGVTAATLVLGTAPIAMLLGVWAARHRVLEEPGRHLKLLRRTAAAGIAVGWAGGLPLALTHSPDAPVVWIQSMTGLPCGVGYAAAFALLAHYMSRTPFAGGTSPAGNRPPRRPGLPRGPVTALAAVGKRSLSCYLAHSVIFAPILAAWGLGLGAHLTRSTMALFATAVWLITVIAAYALERRGSRGPAEIALRHLIGKPEVTREG